MKSLKIGICGVGNVGGAILKALDSSIDLLEIQGRVHFNLVQVGARKGKKAVPFEGMNSFDRNGFLETLKKSLAEEPFVSDLRSQGDG